MGKKKTWLSAVRSAFSSNDSEKLDLELEGKEDRKSRTNKGRRRWSFGNVSHHQRPVDVSVTPHLEKIFTKAEQKEHNHTLAVAAATAAAAEAAVAAANVAAAVVRLTGAATRTSLQKREKTEERAAIKIQTAFRGYLARRLLRALKGLVRLQALVRGRAVRRTQATTALRCMQNLVKIQTQASANRLYLAKENMRNLQGFSRSDETIDNEPSLLVSNNNLQDGWESSTGSLEDIQSRMQSKQEGAMKRDRALAYAFAHQLRKASLTDSATSAQNESDKRHWSWNWMERWMAARPYDANIFDNLHADPDFSSMESNEDRTPTKLVEAGEDRNNKLITSQQLTLSRQSGVPPQKVHHSIIISREKKSAANETAHEQSSAEASKPLKNSQFRLSSLPHTGMADQQGSAASTTKPVASSVGSNTSFPYCNVQLKLGKSSMSSSTNDNNSVVSLPSIPGYMAPTESAKAKVRSNTTQSYSPKENSVSNFEKRDMAFPFSANSFYGVG